MNNQLIPLAAALLALGGLGPSAALQIPVPDALRLHDRDLLSWVIAEQGNQALAQIRAETRHAVRHLEPPALPGHARNLPLNSMLAASE